MKTESLQAAYLFDSILREKFRQLRLSRQLKKAGEISMLMSPAFSFCEWNQFAGDPYAPDDSGQLEYTGDFKLRAKSVLDMAWDMSKEHWEDVEFFIVRERINKYLLASNFLDFADEIIAQPPYFSEEERYSMSWDNEDTEDIAVYKLF